MSLTLVLQSVVEQKSDLPADAGFLEKSQSWSPAAWFRPAPARGLERALGALSVEEPWPVVAEEPPPERRAA